MPTRHVAEKKSASAPKLQRSNTVAVGGGDKSKKISKPKKKEGSKKGGAAGLKPGKQAPPVASPPRGAPAPPQPVPALARSSSLSMLSSHNSRSSRDAPLKEANDLNIWRGGGAGSWEVNRKAFSAAQMNTEGQSEHDEKEAWKQSGHGEWSHITADSAYSAQASDFRDAGGSGWGGGVAGGWSTMDNTDGGWSDDGRNQTSSAFLPDSPQGSRAESGKPNTAAGSGYGYSSTARSPTRSDEGNRLAPEEPDEPPPRRRERVMRPVEKPITPVTEKRIPLVQRPWTSPVSYGGTFALATDKNEEMTPPAIPLRPSTSQARLSASSKSGGWTSPLTDSALSAQVKGRAVVAPILRLSCPEDSIYSQQMKPNAWKGLSGVVGVAPVAREHWYKLMTAGAMSEDPSILPSSRGLLKRSANASSYLRASERRAASVNTVAFQIANAPSNSCSWRPPHFLSMYAPQPASKRPLQKRVWLHASAAAAGDRLQARNAPNRERQRLAMSRPHSCGSICVEAEMGSAGHPEVRLTAS